MVKIYNRETDFLSYLTENNFKKMNTKMLIRDIFRFENYLVSKQTFSHLVTNKHFLLPLECIAYFEKDIHLCEYHLNLKLDFKSNLSFVDKYVINLKLILKLHLILLKQYHF